MKHLILVFYICTVISACTALSPTPISKVATDTNPTSDFTLSLPATPSPIKIETLVPSITVTSTTKFSNTQDCKKPFQEVINLTEAAYNPENSEDRDDTITWSTIVFKTVEASEVFLNNCTQSDVPLEAQSESLTQLVQFAQVVPPSISCFRYSPTVQLLDVNGNSNNELILHTQVANCVYSASAGGSGGLSIVFLLNNETKKWKGQVIWPIPFFVSKEGFYTEWSPLYALTYHPRPLIEMLNIRDSKNRTFMAVSGKFIGASHSANELTLLRWENDHFTVALTIGLSNWCGQPNEWEITKEGHIFIPEAKATDRCEVRLAEMYMLQGDEFIIKQP